MGNGYAAIKPFESQCPPTLSTFLSYNHWKVKDPCTLSTFLSCKKLQCLPPHLISYTPHPFVILLRISSYHEFLNIQFICHLVQKERGLE